MKPQTLDEALEALGSGEDAKVLAGGQSLVPLLNMHLARPALLIDVNALEGLSTIEPSDAGLRLGTLVRHQTLLTSSEVRRAVPLLAEAAALIGHEAIRARGTVGGSIAHADPAAELPMVAIAKRATIGIRSASGSRRVPAEEFFIGYLMTSLGPDEIVEDVLFPMAPSPSGSAVEEFSERHGDFALVAVAAELSLGEDGRVARAGVAVAGAGPAPAAAREVEAALIGQASPEGVRATAKAVAADIAPEDDLHASASYRKHLAEILAARALERAWQRAKAASEAR